MQRSGAVKRKGLDHDGWRPGPEFQVGRGPFGAPARRLDVFDWLSLGLMAGLLVLTLFYWHNYPVHMDTCYHMGVTSGFSNAGGVADAPPGPGEGGGVLAIVPCNNEAASIGAVVR